MASSIEFANIRLPPNLKLDHNPNFITLLRCFSEIVCNRSVDDATLNSRIAEFVHPDYHQETNGDVLNFDQFVSHIRALMEVTARMTVTFNRIVAKNDRIATFHHVQAEKKDGSRISGDVIAVFGFRDGRFATCYECAEISSDDPSDQDMASRTG